MPPLEAIIWHDGHLKILDQLLLPAKSEYVTIKSIQEGWDVISKMQVRGAPAIAIVGCLSLAADLHQDTLTREDSRYSTPTALQDHVSTSLEHLVTARPTAVNMRAEATRLTDYSRGLLVDEGCSVAQMKTRIIEWCEKLLADDVATNRRLGDHGMEAIVKRKKDGQAGVTLVTICNTGALATAGYGTALGVVRSLHAAHQLSGLFMLETRPYLQGARLTALEAVVEGWPGATLVCDGAVGALLATHSIDGAVVGADRVAANGDTANKIGTYQLAVLCQAHGVPLYVCTPFSSVDLSLPSGAAIPIEHRPQHEMAFVAGTRVAAEGVNCWNPAFDVTPARLITGGIVTECGVFRPDELRAAVLGGGRVAV